jgi:hypothetical protein
MKDIVTQQGDRTVVLRHEPGGKWFTVCSFWDLNGSIVEMIRNKPEKQAAIKTYFKTGDRTELDRMGIKLVKPI